MPKKIRHWIGFVWKKCPVSNFHGLPISRFSENRKTSEETEKAAGLYIPGQQK